MSVFSCSCIIQKRGDFSVWLCLSFTSSQVMLSIVWFIITLVIFLPLGRTLKPACQALCGFKLLQWGNFTAPLCFWLIQLCVLLGKDNSDSVLLIQMFSDSSCLAGLPSLTFQCSVTNKLHVQFDIEGHKRFPTAHEAGAALSYGVACAYYHSENHPPVLSCCHKILVLSLCIFFSSFYFSTHSNVPPIF